MRWVALRGSIEKPARRSLRRGRCVERPAAALVFDVTVPRARYRIGIQMRGRRRDRRANKEDAESNGGKWPHLLFRLHAH